MKDKTIQNLSLADLEIGGSILEFKPVPRTRKKEKLLDDPRPTYRPRRSYSPWRIDHLLFIEVKIRALCCGKEWTLPGTDGPLAVFRHKHRPDKTWALAHHPSYLNPSLERKVEVREQTLLCCRECFEAGWVEEPERTFYVEEPLPQEGE